MQEDKCPVVKRILSQKVLLLMFYFLFLLDADNTIFKLFNQNMQTNDSRSEFKKFFFTDKRRVKDREEHFPLSNFLVFLTFPSDK